jgi:hypothetical protein
MIPAILGAAVAVGSAIYGGIKSAKARKSQQNLINEQRQKNEEWYNKNYYSDYMQNADVQSALSQLRDNIYTNNKRIAGASAMRGGTDEARLAAQAEGGRTYGDAIRGIAGQATAYKRGIDAQNQQNQQNILSMMMNMYNQDAANATQMGQNGMNAGIGMMQSSDWIAGLGKSKAPTNTTTIAEIFGGMGYKQQPNGSWQYGN